MAKILYNGTTRYGAPAVFVMIPTDEALAKYTIQEIAEKDVPAGARYAIVDDSVIPTDFTFRDAWEVDEADLTDGVGGDYDMFLDDPSHPDYVAPVEVSE